MSGTTQSFSAERMTTSAASAYLGMSESWLNKERMHGRGPSYYKVGNRCWYTKPQLDQYLESQVQSTQAAA